VTHFTMNTSSLGQLGLSNPVGATSAVRDVRVSSFAVSVHCGGRELIDQFADEWRELCGRARNDQPYYRPEWIGAYFRAYYRRAKVMLFTVRMDGRLHLVLPMVRERRSFSKIPVRKLRTPVNSVADRFDAICSAGSTGDRAIEALWEHLKLSQGWDLLQFQDALEGSVMERLACLAKAEGFSSIELPENPTTNVAIPSSIEEIGKQLPSNTRLRRQLRQIRREIGERGLPLNFRRIETFDLSALMRIYELEASGWKGKEKTDILHSKRRPFLNDLAEAASRSGYLTLYLLELDNHLIAAHYGLTLRNCYYSIVVTYNENFKEFSPGHLIIDEIVRDCARRGVTAFQPGGQNQDWKLRWASQLQPVKHHYIFRGRLGNLAYRVEAQFRPAIARWVRDLVRATKPRAHGSSPDGNEA